jgi:hypothetical protein
MPTRRLPKKRRSKTARAKHANATRGKTPKRAPTPRKGKRSAAAKRRSAAAKKGWAKKRKKQRLIEMMHASNWREVELPTRDELYDYMLWMSDQFEVEISDMYRLYFGYDVGDAAAE